MRRLYETTFTVAAGGTLHSPVPLEDAQLDSVRIVVPDGHNGLTGIAVFWSTAQVLPFNAGAFLVANNEIIDHAWDGEITAAGLSLVGFNNDIFDHTWFLRWVVSDLAAPTPVAIESPQAATTFPAAPSLIVSTLTGALAAADIAQLAAAADATASVPPSLVATP